MKHDYACGPYSVACCTLPLVLLVLPSMHSASGTGYNKTTAVPPSSYITAPFPKRCTSSLVTSLPHNIESRHRVETNCTAVLLHRHTPSGTIGGGDGGGGGAAADQHTDNSQYHVTANERRTDGDYSTLKSRTPAKEAQNIHLTHHDARHHSKFTFTALLHSHPAAPPLVLNSKQRDVPNATPASDAAAMLR